ncbi:uncharacterized protein EV422DRAFT_394087 [Fimicolochytrium jonesii]|uniref:uncharacterized protein n=1 Tax=Fimicolochytrium jonesii TaxID=1396493 RepID=UPI0022FDC0BD|nr:uncharacterized protein EV422DRAFT_394087 [Fimicolochytrium jonesii]KAI8823159.1 hypothetical protein EV422DRAFT_394087 [Fimicolochytrium jonesii]
MIHLNLAGTLSLCRRMERFARALAACTEIRSLSLAAGRMDKVLVKAVSCLPRLEALDVSGTIFDDDQLELVLSSCSRINTLIVDGCNTLTSRAIDLIAAYGGSFTALSVANCNGSVTDYSLQKLAKSHHARTLTRLVLRNNTHVYDYALQIFGRFIRRLEVLDLGGCRDVTAPGLLSFLQGIPEQSLPLTRTPCSSSLEIAHPASHFNSWESPAGTQFTMQQYPTLRALNLTNLGSSFTRAAMHAILHACPKLTTVMIPEHVRGNARTEVMRRCHHSGNEASCGNSLLFQGSSWLRRGEIESAPRPAVLADGGAGDDAVAMVP